MRLIDANALLEKYNVKDTNIAECLTDKKMARAFERFCIIADAVEKQPTVDAVPVAASDRNKLCPINHGLRCKDIENCAFWCEWGQCAVKAIAIACADGGRTHG